MSVNTKRPSPTVKASGSDITSPWSAVLLTPIAHQALQASVAGIELLHANLRLWRGVADTARNSLRHQQDATLRALWTRACSAMEPVKKGTDTETARTFLSPLFEAQRTYEQMGTAMLEAQQKVMAKLSGEERPH